jgi:hypothetical protein
MRDATTRRQESFNAPADADFARTPCAFTLREFYAMLCGHRSSRAAGREKFFEEYVKGMRLFISKAAALGLCVCVLVLAACSPQDGSAPPAAGSSTATGGRAVGDDTNAQTKPPPAPPADDTRRISLEETQAAIKAGNAVVVDVRDDSSFNTGHIKGAISIPLPQFEKRIGELPKGKLIITYCA